MDYRHLLPAEPKYVRGKCDSFNSYSTEKSSNSCRCVSVSPVDSMFSSASSMTPPPETNEKGEIVNYNHQMEVEKHIVCSLFLKNSKIKTCKLPKCFSQDSLQSFAKYFDNKTIEESADYAEIFDLAAAFNVPVLKQTCIKIIKDNIYRYRALDIYNLGHFHACKELTETAFAVIQETFPDLENSYISAPNAINMLVTSIPDIIAFMP